ncbi:DUF4921 family protein [Micrococcus sp. M4NT]|uniref:DUF4921 family protein n=1 Tax=Micrococcus sp. M4NT TaxID=2957501 RepID=UPI0029A495F3|nr:DUF4921 family protein [Micrococcus sp. M4NT]MDX2340348.1 DUF4921 family protein [Micrococcus sp. M4NT]
MLQPHQHAPQFLRTMADGTIKQVNPFSGTEVWTVPGRANRPLGLARPEPRPLDPAEHDRHCAFCAGRYLETPPEKARVVRGAGGSFETLAGLGAEHLFDTVAAFRRVPNLFEILSYDYWRANYGYELTTAARRHRDDYLASEAGRAHVRAVVETKLRAAGRSPDEIDAMSEDETIDAASGFFGGGHDVIIARRHYVDGAADDHRLASAGTLTLDEHHAFIAFTAEAARALYEANRDVRYVSVFQNWLKPAGASFDHLHKQLVAIDERGAQNEAVLARLRADPNVFNEDAVNYAASHSLVIAENEHAVMLAGFGHRYPTLEVYSKSAESDPWAQAPEELRGMSDLLHAAHAATGADVPCNEEWHTRPADVEAGMPWRVCLKWRVSTLAGFEGATKINVNAISPYGVRDRVVDRLFSLRAEGTVAPDVLIAAEAPCRPNMLRYARR